MLGTVLRAADAAVNRPGSLPPWSSPSSGEHEHGALAFLMLCNYTFPGLRFLLPHWALHDGQDHVHEVSVI